MDANLQAQLSIAALACSVVALFFSVLAAFPGLKLVWQPSATASCGWRCWCFWAASPSSPGDKPTVARQPRHRRLLPGISPRNRLYL